MTLPDQAAASSGLGSNRWPMSAGSEACAISPPGFQILKETMRWPMPVDGEDLVERADRRLRQPVVGGELLAQRRDEALEIERAGRGGVGDDRILDPRR